MNKVIRFAKRTACKKKIVIFISRAEKDRREDDVIEGFRVQYTHLFWSTHYISVLENL